MRDTKLKEQEKDEISENKNTTSQKQKKSTKKYINTHIKDKFRKLSNDISRDSRIFFVESRQISDESIIQDHLSKATANAKPKTSKKKKIFNICFFILNIVLVALVFYNFANEQGGIQPLSTLFAKNPKWTYLFIAIGLYVATIIFNSLKFSVLIKAKSGKFRPWFSFKIASIGKYYDNVTPLGTGGQPFEIYYMKKNGYSGDTSTAIPLAKYMSWQVSFVLLCLVVLILYSHNIINATLVLVLAWVGLGLNLALFLFVFFMSVTKKWGASLVVGVLKLLHKMKLIKDYRRTLVKVLKFVKNYQFCIKSFAKNPITVISEIFVTICSIVTNSLIAYFILLAFTETPAVSWWDILCMCCICDIATSLIPLPGGSGAQELSFNALLGALFPEGTLFWGILFWRILTYYIHILQGGCILIVDMIAGRIKTHKKHLETEQIPTNESQIHDIETAQ